MKFFCCPVFGGDGSAVGGVWATDALDEGAQKLAVEVLEMGHERVRE